MNDRELLHEFVTQNCQAAFRQLVERHTDWLYSVCLRRLRDPSLAEDATQAVFLALAQKAPSLLHERTLSPWLHQAAKFVAANILRAQNRRARHESEAAAMTPTLTFSPPLHWQEIETDLEPALDRLPFRDRQMILLRFYEQKSHPEIAAALCISEAAAAKRLERALERLRSLLAGNSAKGASFSSAAITSLLLSHTVTPAPHALAVSTAASTAASTLAKGALMAMTFAKLQTAAIIVTACLIIAVPAAIVITHRTAAPAPPLASTTPNPIPSADDFLTLYAPVNSEPLKFIINAPSASRDALFQYLVHHRGHAPAGPMIINWEPDRPYLSGNYNDSDLAADVLISRLLQDALGLYPQQVEAEQSLPKTPLRIPGDIVICHDLSPQQALPQLETILQNQLNLSVRLSFRDVAVKAIVFKGHWNLTPHPDSPPSSIPLVQIYANNVTKLHDANSFPQGGVNDVALAIGECIHRDIFIEAEGLPHSIRYQFNDATPAAGANVENILNHITQQTGLTWSEEARTVRRLFIESAPAP